MHSCIDCSLTFDKGMAYLSHLKFYHSNVVVSRKLSCAYENCVRSFSDFKSFSKHVNSHKSPGNPKLFRPNSSKSSSIRDHLALESEIIHTVHDNVTVGADLNAVERKIRTYKEFDEALLSAVTTYVASLYDNKSLSDVQIQAIIDAHKVLLGSDFLSIIKENVFLLFDKAVKHQNIEESEKIEIGRMIESCENMFSGFDTHYLRLKQFENSGAYIAPVSYAIGATLDEKSSGGRVTITPKQLTGQFIPMRKVLKGFLELPGVLSTILEYQKELEEDNSGVLKNVVQGSLWQEKIKPIFLGKIVLPLVLYFDDYEANKEKGAHTNVHNVGATYYKIATLPPEFQSSLENIFVANLFHSSDKIFENSRCFRMVLNELKHLEENGICVVTDKGVFQVYIAMVLFIGDNKGANGILGFTECFSANFYCRICIEHKSVMEVQTSSNPEKRRDKINHSENVASMDVSRTGVKAKCMFDELASFDAVENVHLDIMHDLDEGAWKYMMLLVISHFLKAKRFDLESLNNMIQGFNYGRSEQGNKPTVITVKNLKDKVIPFSASEMRCFVRYFGLMVGHLVKEEDKAVWDLYLTARKILDLVTAPSFALSNLLTLRNLIRDHNHAFLDLSGRTLYPKMHFMIHEPDLIPLEGPLEPLSCMRFEGKHTEGKGIAKISYNRINLLLTIAKRHQLRFSYRLLAGRGLVSKFSSSPVHVQFPMFLNEFNNFNSFLPQDNINKEWNLVKWVELNGKTFHLNMVVVISCSSDVSPPVFGSIFAINLMKGTAAFLLKVLDTVSFDSCVHAYEVRLTDLWKYATLKELHHYHPLDIRMAANGKKYVCPRFSL